MSALHRYRCASPGFLSPEGGECAEIWQRFLFCGDLLGLHSRPTEGAAPYQAEAISNPAHAESRQSGKIDLEKKKKVVIDPSDPKDVSWL